MTNRKKQQGAILVISLLLLLILTVLGLAVMRMTRMQERMAGNTRDLNLALQGAEAALRDGEARITAFGTSQPNAVGGAGCGLNVLEVCQRTALPVDLANQSAAWWAANAVPFGAAGTQEFAGLREDPRFVVEEVGIKPQEDLGIGHGLPQDIYVYQVTGRSTGASGQTNTVLQSTFIKIY
jgi:type IV pilus assembly protein PilX